MFVKNLFEWDSINFLPVVSYKSVLVSYVFMSAFDPRSEIRIKEEEFKTTNLEYFKSPKYMLLI